MGDNEIPTKVVLLKRSPDRKFAPNLYTGIGGHVEEGEDYIEAAHRELKEESGIEIQLKEFGRLIINREDALHYFFGIYDNVNLPISDEGKLEWVNTSDVNAKEIIPTTQEFINEWRNRGWVINKLFTVLLEREDKEDLYSRIISREINEGLV